MIWKLFSTCSNLRRTHSVVFEASHVLVSGDTVGTEEVGTVAAACDRLLLGLTAGTDDLSVLDGHHVDQVRHDVVLLEARHVLAHPGHLLTLGTADGAAGRWRGCRRFAGLLGRSVILQLLLQALRAEHVQTAEHTRRLELLRAQLTQVLLVDVGEWFGRGGRGLFEGCSDR